VIIDSRSEGDATTFVALDVLEARLAALPAAPKTDGRVVSLISRSEGGQRTLLDRAVMTPESGMPGDAWGRGRRPNPEAQLTVIQHDVAALIANGQPLELFGDNLILELDLSDGNLPTGSRVRVGGATLEVTPMPHNGCRKFRARFGVDALQLVSDRALRHRNLRGVYMRVVESGEVALGDPVTVVARGVAVSASPVRS
jgi:MOSC domain-containing protein YiiM